MLLLIDESKFESNKALAYVLTIRPDILSYQHIIERISGDEPANQTLRLH